MKRSAEILVIGALLFGGCGDGGDAPPAIKGTLHIRSLMALTGATSDNGKEYYQGIKDALREANERPGGVAGWRFEEQVYDHSYMKPNWVAKYAEWKAQPDWAQVLMLFTWGTPDTSEFSADAAIEGKPFISGSYATTLATPMPQTRMVTMPDGTEKTFNANGAPFNFFAGTDYSTQIRIAMRFVQDKGGHKVAFAYCTGSTFCTEPIPAGKTFAKEINLAIGPDFNPELADNAQVIDDKMKAYAAANPDVDWFWVGNSTSTTIPTIQAVKKYLPNAKVIANLYGFDERCGTSVRERLRGDVVRRLRRHPLPGHVRGGARAREVAQGGQRRHQPVQERPLRAGLRQLPDAGEGDRAAGAAEARRSPAATSRTRWRPSARRTWAV